MRAPKHILSLSLLFALLPLAQEEEGDAQALFSKLAGMAVELGLESSGSKSISLEDDPYLGKLGEDILKLLVERDAEDYLDSSVATSRDVQALEQGQRNRNTPCPGHFFSLFCSQARSGRRAGPGREARLARRGGSLPGEVDPGRQPEQHLQRDPVGERDRDPAGPGSRCDWRARQEVPGGICPVRRKCHTLGRRLGPRP